MWIQEGYSQSQQFKWLLFYVLLDWAKKYGELLQPNSATTHLLLKAFWVIEPLTLFALFMESKQFTLEKSQHRRKCCLRGPQISKCVPQLLTCGPHTCTEEGSNSSDINSLLHLLRGQFLHYSK